MAATASWDKSAYNVGDTMKATVAGTLPHTVTTQETVGPVTIPVASANSQSTVELSAVQVTRTTTTDEDVFIDAAAGATLDLAGKQWTVSADRKSITAAA
jgi:hypothetical protein